MDIELLGCGYSFFSKPFTITYTDRLPYFLFRLQTEGSCLAMVNGEMKKIEPGDLLLYPSGESCELRADKGEEGSVFSGDYFLFCNGTWVREWWNRSKKPTFTHIDMDERILSLWRNLHIENHKVGETNLELIGYLLRALCLNLERAVIGAASVQGPSNRSGKFVSNKMKRYIEDHATQTFKIQDVAEHVGLSVSRAVTLFKESFGFTMIQYAVELRLSSAVELMKYGALNLEQVAESCGFGNYSYFHRAFKNKHGVSPAEFRLQSVQQAQHFKNTDDQQFMETDRNE
jgi:AraC family transcriptional regulator of arabinose operon